MGATIRLKDLPREWRAQARTFDTNKDGSLDRAEVENLAKVTPFQTRFTERGILICPATAEGIVASSLHEALTTPAAVKRTARENAEWAVHRAISQRPHFVNESKSLGASPDLVLRALRASRDKQLIGAQIPAALQNNRVFAKEAILEGVASLRDFPALRGNEAFISDLINTPRDFHASTLEGIARDASSSFGIMVAAIERDPASVRYVSDELLAKPEFLRELLA